MSNSTRATYRVYDVEIHVGCGSVKRGGVEHVLRRQTFQVLLYLLKHRDRFVSKEELGDAIWNGTVVTDDALVQCVVDIRKALGDDRRASRFIRTVPKVGYRFVGPLEEGAASEREGPSWQDPSGLAGRATRLARRRWLGPALGVVVGGALAIAATLLAIQAPWSGRTIPEAAVTLGDGSGAKRVAVMYFENQSGSGELAWLRQGLPDMIIGDLSAIDRVSVLTRPQLDLLLERAGIPREEPIRLDHALDIARRSHAEVIVLGSFAVLGDKIRLEVRLHDGRSGQVIGSDAAVAEGADQILTQVDVLTVRMAKRLGVPAGTTIRARTLADIATDNLEAFRYYVLGVEKSYALRSAEAIELLQKAVAIDPRFAMAHARIGYTYAVRLNYPDRARPYLEKAYELSDRLTPKDRLYIQGWYAIANLDYAGAIEVLRRLIAAHAYEPEAYWQLGNLLVGEGQLEQAVSVFQQGLVIDPDNPDVYNNLGSTLSKLGRHAQAIAAHARYVTLAPKEANAYDSLGLTYQWAGLYEQAINSYERAIRLDPKFEVAAIHLGNTYFQLGRYRDALRQYRRYIDVADFPAERARGYDAIASVLFRRGEIGNAWAAVRRGQSHADGPTPSAIVVAIARGDLAGATETRDAIPPEVWANRGYRASGRFDEYVDGYLALRHGRAAEAIDHFREAIRHPAPTHDPEPREECLADAYLELGRLDEAVAEYKRVLRLNPNAALARYSLAQALARKGERTSARLEYERFLEIWRGADPDLPQVLDAKRQLRALRAGANTSLGLPSRPPPAPASRPLPYAKDVGVRKMARHELR